MSEIEDLARRAVDEPIRTPPAIGALVSASRVRRRRRVATALLGATVAVAAVAFVAFRSPGRADRVETAESVPAAAQPTVVDQAAQPTAPGEDVAPLDLASLTVALTDRQATVTEIEPQPSGFFAGTPSGLCVNDRQIRVYEYDTVDDRESESTEITPDGQPNALTFVSWVGPPRFFAAGRLIVLDLSGDGAVEDLLASVMGPTLSPDAFGRPSEEPPCGENLDDDPGERDGDALPPPTQPELSPEAVEEAEALTASLIDALGRGDLASASDLWTSYPFDPAGPELELIRVMDSYAWLSNEDVRLVVVPSFARLEAQPVVTVVSGDLATTFVMSLPVAGEPLRIERLPNTEDFDVLVSPSPGSTVNPGDTIVFGTMPLEGGSRAFLEDQELVVVVDHEALTTSVVLPEQLPAEFVLTLTGATPEEPVAFAFTYRSAEP